MIMMLCEAGTTIDTGPPIITNVLLKTRRWRLARNSSIIKYVPDKFSVGSLTDDLPVVDR